MPYRVFAIHLIGGVFRGVGYSLLGYLAGSAHGVVERTVGAGLAIAIAVIVVGAVAVWPGRRHRRGAGIPLVAGGGEFVAGELAVQPQAAVVQPSAQAASEPQAGEPHADPGVV